jgi:DNA-binding response OmpR family regulator
MKERGMARILVVDDDPDVVESVKLYLEKEGHTVEAGYNREEGMQAVEKETPELLILDVMMEQPDDGFAMAQDLRRMDIKVPIVMMTSIGKITGLDYDKDGSVVPVDVFLEKPVDPAKLVETVATLLAGKKED